MKEIRREFKLNYLFKIINKKLMFSRIVIISLFLITGICFQTFSQTNYENNYFGVSLAGAEFGTNIPGNYNVDYTYPTPEELDYYNSKGFKLIRLPFRWERIQHTLNGALNADELSRMISFIDAAAARDMYVLLDMHNYGKYISMDEGNNIALFKTATASSQEAPNGFFPSEAVDGYEGSRWASQKECENCNEEWIKIDLGAVSTIETVVINWEAASAKSYHIMVSNVNSEPDPASPDWTIISTQTDMPDQARIDHIENLNASGRYIAMYGYEKQLEYWYGYSIWEFKVYEENFTPLDPTIGSPDVSVSNFVDVWKKLAIELKDKPNIWGYGLMNEPDDMNYVSWKDIAQAVINGIRQEDTETKIVVGGDNKSSAELWYEYSDNLKELTDPSDNLVFEAHCYFDNNSEGSYAYSYAEDGADQNTGIERVTPFINWLKENNKRGFLGEYGIPYNVDTEEWNVVLDNFLNYIQSNGVNGTCWAGGPWWPAEYKLSVEPSPLTNPDRPPMSILTKYLSAGEFEIHLDVPYVSESQSVYTGAACAEMILDYQGSNTITQSSIQQYGTANNYSANTGADFIDPYGMYRSLNHFELDYRYNYAQLTRNTRDEAYRDLCYWISYSIPNTPREHLPSVVPINGNFNDWFVINGFQSSVNPHELPNYTVYGFYVTDPRSGGVGHDMFIQANTFGTYYYHPIISSDIWNGKYVTVDEPPAGGGTVSVELERELIEPSSNELRFLIVEYAFNDYNLDNNSAILDVLSAGVQRDRIYFVDLAGTLYDYYIVTYSRSGNDDCIVVAIIDANNGAMKLLTYNEPDYYYYYWLDNYSGYTRLKSSEQNDHPNSLLYPAKGSVSLTNESDVNFMDDKELEFEIIPNPASNFVRIGYNIVQESMVNISMYDLSGKLVKTIASQKQAAGYYNMEVNLQDINNGIYLIRYNTNEKMEVKKMIINK